MDNQGCGTQDQIKESPSEPDASSLVSWGSLRREGTLAEPPAFPLNRTENPSLKTARHPQSSDFRVNIHNDSLQWSRLTTEHFWFNHSGELKVLPKTQYSFYYGNVSAAKWLVKGTVPR